MQVKLDLLLEEAVAIVNLLGSLQTKQGAWPLFVKLKNQVEPLVYQSEKAKSLQEPSE